MNLSYINNTNIINENLSYINNTNIINETK